MVVIGVIWWMVMFIVVIVAHLLIPIDKPNYLVRLVTFGTPIAAMFVGVRFRDWGYGLLFLSPIIISILFDMAARFAGKVSEGMR